MILETDRLYLREMIGQCGLTMQPWRDEEVLEIGYLFQRQYWHKGYAIEAARACKKYAFEVLERDEVCSIIRDTNTASQNVAVRNGMVAVDHWVKHYRGVDMPHDRYAVTDKRNYVFRKIRKEEFDKLRDLFPDNERMWLKYRDMRLKEFDRKEIDVYVIEQNITFVGELSVAYISHDLASEAIPDQRVYLQAFRLDKQYQGLGLGQRLLQFVLSDLEQQGYTEFTIGVEDDNKIAKHIYFKFGFTEAIDRGCGDEFDPSDYTLYMRSPDRRN